MQKIAIATIIAGMFVAASFAGCIGSDEDGISITAITIFAKGTGDWTNVTLVETLTELMAPENREAPASRTRSAPTVTFKTDGAGAVTWDFGDGVTLEADAFDEVSHEFGVTGVYKVAVFAGEVELQNMTVVINYHATCEDSVQPAGTHVESGPVEDRNFHVFTVTSKAKIVVATQGKAASATGYDTDVGLELYDPAGKLLGYSDSMDDTPADEMLEYKAKTTGDYKAMVGAIMETGSFYINPIPVEYILTIDVTYN